VPRGNIYQDGEIEGTARLGPFPEFRRKGGRKTRWGGSTQETGDFPLPPPSLSLFAGQKGLSFHRTALHVVLTLSS